MQIIQNIISVTYYISATWSTANCLLNLHYSGHQNKLALNQIIKLLLLEVNTIPFLQWLSFSILTGKDFRDTSVQYCSNIHSVLTRNCKKIDHKRWQASVYCVNQALIKLKYARFFQAFDYLKFNPYRNFIFTNLKTLIVKYITIILPMFRQHIWGLSEKFMHSPKLKSKMMHGHLF